MLHYLTMCQKTGTPTASAASYSAYSYNCTCSATYAYICKSSATYVYICKSSATYAYIYKCSAIFYDYIFTSAGITSAQVQLSLVHVGATIDTLEFNKRIPIVGITPQTFPTDIGKNK